jgi:hypothetical protein
MGNHKGAVTVDTRRNHRRSQMPSIFPYKWPGTTDHTNQAIPATTATRLGDKTAAAMEATDMGTGRATGRGTDQGPVEGVTSAGRRVILLESVLLKTEIEAALTVGRMGTCRESALSHASNSVSVVVGASAADKKGILSVIVRLEGREKVETGTSQRGALTVVRMGTSQGNVLKRGSRGLASAIDAGKKGIFLETAQMRGVGRAGTVVTGRKATLVTTIRSQ